jgi:hypothetical protein
MEAKKTSEVTKGETAGRTDVTAVRMQSLLWRKTAAKKHT